MRRIFVLSIILQFSFIGYAQTKSAKLEKRINGYFIVDNNLTYKIDDKLLLAKLKPGKSLKNGIRGTNASPSGIIRISVPDNSDPGGYMSYLEQTGDFEFVDFNGYYTPYMTPNDSYISDQWYLNNINIYNAWNITTGSSSVKVAVIDVGVSSSHPDLSSNLSPYEGFDYVNNTCPSIIGDRHGTMVAGIISARTNNNMGIAGIAGGNNSAGVKIIPYRTDLTDNDIISALDDAVSKGAKVVNMSFGGAGYNYALSQSITNAYNNGVTIICASGNSNATQLPYPAGYPNTIAVGASNQSNGRWHESSSQGSNYGNGLDLIAPGESIKSTDYYNGNNGYFTDSGTSYSAPQVAGVAALMLSVKPSLTPSQIADILRNTCTKITGYSYNTSGWNIEVGYGLLNAYAAVLKAYLNLSGSYHVCSTESYTIQNLPSGATVQWSASNSKLSLVSGQGTGTATFQKVSNGACTITAQVTLGTTTVSFTKDVWAGTPTAPTVTGWPHTNLFMENTEYDFVAHGNSQAQILEYQWTVIKGATLISGGNSSNATFLMNSPGPVSIRVRARNACGWGPYTNKSGGITDDNGLIPINSPGNNIVSIPLSGDGEYEIQLWNTNRMIRSTKTTKSSYDVDLSNLPSDLYIIKVLKDGQNFNQMKVKK